MSIIPKRIDQHLFINIIKQCYETDKAWKDWLKEYTLRSERERRAYNSFSSKLRKFSNKDTHKDSNIELYIFTKWCEMTEEEREKWIDETRLIDELFIDVNTFLRMFQHNI